MKKKILAAVVAVVLVCAISVAGTLAYLTAPSNGGNAIKNTFVASKGLIDPPTDQKPNNGFKIVETDATDSSKTTTTGNTYTVLPGQDITKDPKVVIVGKTDVKSYLFAEAVDGGLAAKGLTWAINDTEWKLIEKDAKGADLVGPNGGKIYVYKSVVSADVSSSLIKNDKITVSKDYAGVPTTDDVTLEFYGYLCQQATFEPATTSDADYLKAAATAFTTCFPATE